MYIYIYLYSYIYMYIGSHYEYDAIKIKQAYGAAIDKYLGPGEKMGGMCICIYLNKYIYITCTHVYIILRIYIII
jgi:hypothetical protein